MAEETRSIVEAIAKLKATVIREFRAELLGVFGSVARGDQTAGSDVDVLVRFLPEATLFDLVGLADYLEEKLNRRVDVVPVDAVRDEIRERVLKEAIPV